MIESTGVQALGADLMLGVIIDRTVWPIFPAIAAAVPIAIEEINLNQTLTGGLRLGFKFGGDPACAVKESLRSLSLLLDSYEIDAIIGPGCSAGCEPTALLTGSNDIFQVSHSCATATLSNKEVYPTFARLVASDTLKVVPVTRFLQFFGFKQAVLVYSRQGSVFALTFEAIDQELRKAQITPSAFPYSVSANKTELLASVKKSGINVLIFLCYDTDLELFAKAGKQAGNKGFDSATFRDRGVEGKG